MLNTLTQTLHSMTKSLEIIYVSEGLKDTARIVVNENKVPEVVELLKKLNLKATISDFKIKKETDDARLYSDKGFILKKNSPLAGEFFLYVSRNSEMAEKAKFFESENNHSELGKVLGYPDCCIEFFAKNFPVESKKKNDYVLAILANSSGYKFPFYNNVAIRHLDLTLLSHFPCSFNCEKSLQIAKRNLQLIRTISLDVYKIFEGMLKSAVIYTENDGVFVLRDFRLEGDKLFYNSLICSTNNKLYSALKSSESVTISDKNSFFAADINFKGEDFGIMLFH